MLLPQFGKSAISVYEQVFVQDGKELTFATFEKPDGFPNRRSPRINFEELAVKNYKISIALYKGIVFIR